MTRKFKKIISMICIFILAVCTLSNVCFAEDKKIVSSKCYMSSEGSVEVTVEYSDGTTETTTDINRAKELVPEAFYDNEGNTLSQSSINWDSRSMNVEYSKDGKKQKGWNETIKYCLNNPDNSLKEFMGGKIDLSQLKVDFDNYSNAKANFNDVSENDWCYSAISKCEKLGLICGYGDGNFGPNDPVTREQTYLIIDRLSKVWNPNFESWEDQGGSFFATPAQKISQDLFKINVLIDPEGNLEYGYNKYYKENMQISFSPREEAVSLVTRYIAKSRNTMEEMKQSAPPIYELNNAIKFLIGDNSFNFYEENENPIIPDFNEIDTLLKDDIKIAYSKGFANGYNDKGEFKPKSSVTRAEFCQMVYNSGLMDYALLYKNKIK